MHLHCPTATGAGVRSKGPAIAVGRSAYRCAVIDDEPSGQGATRDHAEIEGMVAAFFAAFASGTESPTRLGALRSMFLPQAVIVGTCGAEPMVCGVEGFITPRETLLSGGALVDFKEWEVSARIDQFGNIAHWFGNYAKSGVRDGVPFTGKGMKSVQFVRTSEGWRISAVAWDDERSGLTIPA